MGGASNKCGMEDRGGGEAGGGEAGMVEGESKDSGVPCALRTSHFFTLRRSCPPPSSLESMSPLNTLISSSDLVSCNRRL